MEIRTIDPGDSVVSAKLARLVAGEPAIEEGFSWQDRSPDFFALYRHIGSGAPRFWGAFAADRPDEPVAVSGFVPIDVSWLNAGVTVHLQNDAFTAQAFRDRLAFPALVRAHCEYFRDQIPGPTISIGIENQSGSLQALAAIVKRFGFGCLFLEHTRFSEAYCGLSAAPEPGPGSLARVRLSELGSSLKALFTDRLIEKARTGLFSPNVSETTWRKLAAADPQAGVLIFERGGRVTAGLVAVDLSSIRRFRFNGQENSGLWKTVGKLRAERGERPFVKNDVLPVLILSLFWHEPGAGADLTQLIRASYRAATEEGYLCVGIRDLPPELFPGELTASMHYGRRIVLIFRPEERAVFKKPGGGRMSPAMDSAFL